MRRIFVFGILLSVLFSAVSSADQAVPRPQVEELKRDLAHKVQTVVEARRAGKSEEAAKRVIAAAQPTADFLHSYDVLHYQLDVTFDIPGPTLSGVVTVQCQSNEAGLSHVSFHLVALTVDEVLRNGLPTTYAHADGEIDIDLGASFNTGQEFEVSISYHGDPAAGYYSGGGIYFTAVEPSYARYWWPCYDEPWDKATLDLNATVPSGYIVASNGKLTETVDTPGEGTVTYRWSESYPIATYLVSVSIAKFATWSDTYTPVGGGDPMDILFYAAPVMKTAAEYDFERVDEMIECFVPLFGEYPFIEEKYGMSVVPMSGAMEHQTCTSWMTGWVTGHRYIENEVIVAHELSHQWWGDMVTLVNWCEMWLNEGFATYSEALWVEHLFGEEGLQIYTRYYIQDVFKGWESRGAANKYPIYCPPPGHLFSSTEYEKGGCVLHMLRFVVGTDLFFEGIRTYGERYKYGNASTEDLKTVFQEVTGRNLDWFFDQWIYEQGYPEYEFMWQAEDAGGGHYDIQVNVNQIQSNAPVFTMPVEFTVYTPAGDVTDTVTIDQAHQSFTLSVDDEPDSVHLDPFGWILKNVRDITSPTVCCAGYSLDDASGDGDLVPDPGETVDLMVDLHNTGLGVETLSAAISTDCPDIRILNGTADFEYCGYNQIVSNMEHPFVFEIDGDMLSQVVPFTITVSDGQGYEVTDTLHIVVGPATVLLVDDDMGATYDDYFAQGLLVTYPFDSWTVASQGVPSAELSSYEAVVWLTGDDRETSLTSDEQAALAGYLDGGGNLFLSGQNIGYDLVEDGTFDDAAFFHEYLHAEYAGDESDESILSGVTGDPISGDIVFLTLALGGAGNQNSPSIIEPLEGASSVLTYNPSGDAAGIKYSNGHKVVYFAFGYESIGDFFGVEHAKRRATIMDNVIDWFRYAPRKGDVSEDGKINVIDVIIGVNIILGVIDPTPDQFWAADITGDGTVNVLDIIGIVNVILGTAAAGQ